MPASAVPAFPGILFHLGRSLYRGQPDVRRVRCRDHGWRVPRRRRSEALQSRLSSLEARERAAFRKAASRDHRRIARPAVIAVARVAEALTLPVRRHSVLVRARAADTEVASSSRLHYPPVTTEAFGSSNKRNSAFASAGLTR